MLAEVLPFACVLGIGELFEQDVRFTVEVTVTLLDDAEADGLREVALAHARRTEEARVLVLADEARGRELGIPSTIVRNRFSD